MLTRRKCISLLYYIFIIITLCFLLHPDRNARRTYDFLKKEEILSNLHFETISNLSSSASADCNYENVLLFGSAVPVSAMEGGLWDGQRIKEGGEYVPSNCKPKFSTAVVVPYRDRAEQLRGFLMYMHSFLRRQKIHYRIYVVEQINLKPFNRAKLLNIGAAVAMRAGFPCVVLHDVDLLPLQSNNLYACTQRPRHMSSSINKFRFTLPYLRLFGGAVAILSSQFKAINGMSNEYFGWGAEDDDLYSRIEANNLTPCRFDPEISRYHMVTHKAQTKGEKNKWLLSYAVTRMDVDGLNSLKYTEVSRVLHPLFTHIMVDF